MPVIDQTRLKQVILSKYTEAQKSTQLLEKYAAVSNRIPNYNADKMSFGTYHCDSFVTLFADMRRSSKRSTEIGPVKTFLTLHAVMPTLIYVVEEYGGYVIDLPGDGIMALFKENRKKVYWTKNNEYLNAESLAVECGKDLLKAINNTVNGILLIDDIPPVTFGIGIDSGSVVVTKTGTDRTFDTKAIGDSVNMAAKKSHGENEIWISKNVFEDLQGYTRIWFLQNNQEPNWYVREGN